MHELYTECKCFPYSCNVPIPDLLRKATTKKDQLVNGNDPPAAACAENKLLQLLPPQRYPGNTNLHRTENQTSLIPEIYATLSSHPHSQ
uniref:Uncharacterized protein n=1 Tax=Anguilla anguilla TaxID=7936 RepID=A0A0E9W7K9_ANGAN